MQNQWGTALFFVALMLLGVVVFAESTVLPREILLIGSAVSAAGSMYVLFVKGERQHFS